MPMPRMDFNEEVALEILEEISDGKSLNKICQQDGMPSRKTVYRWLAKNPEFGIQLAHARRSYADTIFDEVIDIADDVSEDHVEEVDEETGQVTIRVNKENIMRSRVRIDTRKWVCGQLNASKYGNKSIVEVGGQPDGQPIEHITRIELVAATAPAQLPPPDEIEVVGEDVDDG